MRTLIAVLAFVLVFSGSALAAQPKVKVETNMGNFLIELYQDKSPKTVKNFLTYVRSGFYDGTIFHRVISGFVIQGGGYDQNMREKPTRAPIDNEAMLSNLKNKRYTLSMARTNDPHSATSQFFVNLRDNSTLDYTAPTGQGYGYAVFGRVTQGQDVIDAIARVVTGRFGMHSDVPMRPVIIKRMTLMR
jgi:cyclophilin family peptidyl-prolyl cis-trans isomerase